MIVTYFKVSEYAQSIASLGKVDPILGLWGPFLIFAGLVLWMYYQIAYVPGGQPIGGLEKIFAKLSKLVRRLLPMARPAPEAGA